MTPDILYRIAFSRLHGINVKLAGQILPRIGNEERFFGLTPSQLGAALGFKSKLFDEAVRRNALDEARRELVFVESNAIRTLYFTEPDYPRQLLDCDDAPVMLYSLGSMDFNTVSCLSIVGTRKATVYGTSFIDKLVGTIAATVGEPVAIVSGLAFGIDISAHKAALATGLPTVAVLAHGLNRIYPAEHRRYAADIVAKGGALLTEYASIDPIHKGNFLARNRIVAGLAQAVLVAESDIKGGAMATARLATDYGRDVFALPGRINDRYSAGCNHLIARNIAGITTSPDDLIGHMGWHMRDADGLQQELFRDLTPPQQQVVELLTKNGEMRLGELQIQLGESAGKLAALLVDMEFDGLVTAIPGGRYRLS